MPLYLGDKLISGQSREIAEEILEEDVRLVPGGVIKKYVDSNTISPSGGTITGPLEIVRSSVKTSSNGNVAYSNPGLKYWGESNLTGTLVLNFGSDASHMAADVVLANQKVNAILCLSGYASTNGFSWARATGLVGGLELKVRTAGDVNGNHYFLIGEVNTNWGGYLQSNVTNLLKHVDGDDSGSCVEVTFVTNESTFTNIKEIEIHGGEIPTVESLNAVPQTRKINGKTLEADVTLSAADVNARSDTWMPSATDVGARPNTWTPTAADVGAVPVTRKINGVALSADITLGAADIGAVPTTRKINNKALNADITLDAEDVGARSSTWLPSLSTLGAVPTTRKVNNKALSADITLTAADMGALKFYGSFEELGLTEATATVEGIVNAMANGSMLMVNCSTAGVTSGLLPSAYGMLSVEKRNNYFTSFEYRNGSGFWRGYYNAANGSGIYWTNWKLIATTDYVDNAISNAGGHIVSATAPSNTNLLWIDTANGGVLKYHDGSSWVGVKGVWG